MHHFNRLSLSLSAMFLFFALLPAISQDRHIVWMTGGHVGFVSEVLISPGNKYALSVGETAKLWSLETGELIHIFQNTCASTIVPPYQFSPDGKYLAFADSTRVGLWILQDRRIARYYNGLRGLISCLAFSNTSEWIGAGGADSTLIVWPTSSNEKAKELHGRSPISQIQFIDDGHLLILAGPDYKSEIWDANLGKKLMSSTGQNFGSSVILRDSATKGSLICILGKSPPGRITIPVVNVYNAYTGKLIKHLSADKRNWSDRTLAFSPDGSKMAVGERDILRIYDWKTEKVQLSIPISGLRGPTHFSPDGKFVACVSDKWGVNVHDASTGSLVSHFGGYLIWSFNFSSDSKKVLCGTENGEVLYYDAENGDLNRRLTLNNDKISAIIPSRNGTKVAALAENGIITLWKASTGVPIWNNRGNMMKTKCAAFSPDDATLAIINVDEEYDAPYPIVRWKDAELGLFGSETGSPVRILPAPAGYIGLLRFVNDGREIVAFNMDKSRFLFWDTTSADSPSYKQLNRNYEGIGISANGSFQIQSDRDIGWVKVFVPFSDSVIANIHAHNGFVRTISFTDNDRFMVTTGQDDNSLKCWNLPSGELVKSMTIPSPGKDFWGGIMVGGVSSSGRYFAGGSRDGTISIWDLDRGEKLKSYKDIPIWVWSFAWSPNEQYIYAATTDGSLFCWDTGIHR